MIWLVKSTATTVLIDHYDSMMAAYFIQVRNTNTNFIEQICSLKSWTCQ